MTGAQYTCGSAQRRGAVLQLATLNGIDFLEVLDAGAVPLGLPRQTTLLLHFLHPVAGLAAANFVVEGGVRTRNLSIQWAFRANAVPAALLTPAQAAWFAKLPNAANIMVLQVSASGDDSTYTLSLASGQGQLTAPAGFDPRLASVDFSFKVECPSDFDCAPAAPCAPAPVPELPIDYLARDYGSFRQLMLDRMATTIPGWTERSPADLGVTLVETLAYAADRLSYFQDAVATEAYLSTARRRVSVRRHARLLDYTMHDGANARAWVFVEVSPAAGVAYIQGPGGVLNHGVGTLFLTQSTLPAGPLSAAAAQAKVASGAALPFEAMHDLTAYPANNEIHFYTWSDDSCCLPAGATSATLSDPGNAVMLQPGDALLIEEVASPLTGSAADADASHRSVVRLTSVTPNTDPLTGARLLEVSWAPGDALSFAVCISAAVAADGGAIHRDLSVVRGNLVLVDHGITIAAEPLQPAIPPAAGPYRPTLSNAGLTFSVPYGDAQARTSSAASLVAPDPRTALPAISLEASEARWSPALTLLNATPFQPGFVVETEDDGSTTLRFGDGTLGELPEAGMTATYRVGNGSAGNIGAEGIANVVAPGILAVRNPMPALGGIDPEPTDDVRLFAPQAFRVQQRAVTQDDYIALTEALPGVQKAQATRRWTGSWYTTFVTVEPQPGTLDRVSEQAFEQATAASLDPFRLMGYDLQIKPPVYVPLDIAFTVCIQTGYLRGSVEAALYQAFSNRPMANGIGGFFYPGDLTFGSTIYLSRIIARAMQVPGVQWIDTSATTSGNRFQRWGQNSAGELAAGQMLFSQFEIPQLANDPNTPENGRIQFSLQGGL